MRFLFLLLFALYCSSSLAQIKDGIELSSFSISKVPIAEDKVLTEQEQVLVKESLVGGGRILIDKRLTPIKNDYVGDNMRGTVKYLNTVKNYSFHFVVIPDGTTVSDSNFTQDSPNTDAIFGSNLTFIDCNLINVLVHKDWKIIRSNNYQTKTALSSKDIGVLK